MFEAVANLLQSIVQPCYELTGNWWVSIALFTLITKIILMPMGLWVQWNSIKMVQVMPKLNRIKAKYFGDKETIGEKQAELNKEVGYHPLLSLIPLAVQVLILFGLVDVIHSITDTGGPGTEFLGMVPIEDGGSAWMMPVLAALSAVLLGVSQNHINPLQREQSHAEQNMTNGLSIGISLFLGIYVAAGMAFYWICSNLAGIAVQTVYNIIINPRKYIDYEDLAESRKDLEELESLEGGRKKKWYQLDQLDEREKADYKKFFSIANKHIVFYSEGSGFYKYYKGAIEYLLKNGTGVIHYVTNDPNDQVFNITKSHPRLMPYYISQKRAITLMMKMDADVVVTTLMDLDNYYIKRSYIRKDIEYVYMFHHMTSTHLVSRKEAFDHYETIMCVGPHQVAEIRKAEELYDLPRKNLIEVGYDLLDEEIASYLAMEKNQSVSPVVLVAPSWQEDNILDTCIDDMISGLLNRNMRIIVRPHPEYVKRYHSRWEALQARHADTSEKELLFEQDFSSNSTIWTSDVLITDWSSIACEFSFSTLKPCIFVDTPMKINNPSWKELGIDPTDLTLRNQIGISINPDNARAVGDAVSDMIEHAAEWSETISSIRSKTIFNLGSGGEAAGKYLCHAIQTKQEQHEIENA